MEGTPQPSTDGAGGGATSHRGAAIIGLLLMLLLLWGLTQWSWFWDNLLAIWFGLGMVVAVLGAWLAGRARQWGLAVTRSIGFMAGVLFFTVGIFPELAYWQRMEMAFACVTFLTLMPDVFYRLYRNTKRSPSLPAGAQASRTIPPRPVRQEL